MTLVRAHCGVLRGRVARDQVRSGGDEWFGRKIARFAALRSIRAGNVVYV